MRLYLITHAHTQQDYSVDSTKWILSAAGVAQTNALQQLPFWSRVDRIVLSSEPKTYLTVQPVLEMRQLPITADARFDELLRPGYVDDYAEQVQSAFAQPDVPAGEWEAAAQAQSRFCAGITNLQARFPDQTLALVGHGLTLSLYRAWLLHQSHVSLHDWQNLSFAAVALAAPSTRQLHQDFAPVGESMARGR